MLAPGGGSWVKGSLSTWLHSLEVIPSPANPHTAIKGPALLPSPGTSESLDELLSLPGSEGLGCGAGNHSPAQLLSCSPCCHVQLPNCTHFPGQDLPCLPLPRSVAGQPLQPAHTDALLHQLPVTTPWHATSLRLSCLPTKNIPYKNHTLPRLTLTHTLSKVLLSRQLLTPLPRPS